MLEDKVIYITGGSSGIGLSIAEHCLKNNAQVVITGRNEERLEKAKKTLSEFSPDVITAVSYTHLTLPTKVRV